MFCLFFYLGSVDSQLLSFQEEVDPNPPTGIPHQGLTLLFKAIRTKSSSSFSFHLALVGKLVSLSYTIAQSICWQN